MCVWFLFCVTFNIKHFHDVRYGFYARILGFILVSQSPQYMSLWCVHGHTWVLYDLHTWEYITYTYCILREHACIVHVRTYACVWMCVHVLTYVLLSDHVWFLGYQNAVSIATCTPAPPLFNKSVIFTNLIYIYILIL